MKRTTCDRCGITHDLLMPIPDINPSGICPQYASIESIRNQAFLHLTQGQKEFITNWFNFWVAAGFEKKDILDQSIDWFVANVTREALGIQD
jgi:hypothetical protein